LKEAIVTNQPYLSAKILRPSTQVFVMALLCVLTMVATQPAQAQTYSVLHYFTGAGDGGNPTSLLVDQHSLYGTTPAGGSSSYGAAFKLSQGASGWALTTIYSFLDTDESGAEPQSLSLGPDGRLYGTTAADITITDPALATVFSLTPPATPCRNVVCSWTQTQLYSFPNLEQISPPLIFDGSGNIFGTTPNGGTDLYCYQEFGCGTFFELSPSGGGWFLNTIYDFETEWYPNAVVSDNAGNFYGDTIGGGSNGYGAVFEFSPNGRYWSETVLYNFTNGSDGGVPFAALLRDAAGNLYGTTSSGGGENAGTIFELSPAAGGWVFNVLYNLPARSGYASQLSMDSAGNLYGTTRAGGVGYGTVFELTPSNGSWTFTVLHAFDLSHGGNPHSGVVFDNAGNLYGTAYHGGIAGSCEGVGCGVVWKITR